MHLPSHQSIISQFTQAFPVAESGLGMSENATLVELALNRFKVSMGQNDWFLKITEKPGVQIEKENALLHALHEEAPRLFHPYMKTKSGSSFVALEKPDRNALNLVAMPFIEHFPQFNWKQPSWSSSYSFSAGNCLRQFHQTSRQCLDSRTIDIATYEPASPLKTRTILLDLLDSTTFDNGNYGAAMPPFELLRSTVAGFTFTSLAVEEAPIILHGDFHAGNLLFEEQKVRAIIDFDAEFSMLGQPCLDLAYALMAFSAPWSCQTYSADRKLEDCLQMDHFNALLNGYGDQFFQEGTVAPTLLEALAYASMLYMIWAIDTGICAASDSIKVLSTATNTLMSVIKKDS